MRSSVRFLFLLAVLPGSAVAGGSASALTGATQPQAVAVAKAALASLMGGADGAWTEASLPVGRTALVMQVESGAFCGDVGCPTAVLLPVPGGWSAVWTGLAAERVKMLASTHHGLHDIAVAERDGWQVLRFDGHAYAEHS